MTNIYLPTIAKRGSNEKLVFFSFILRNMPGMIAKIAKVFFENNINILYGVHSVNKNLGYWIFLADVTNIKKPLEHVVGELRNIKGVLEVNYGINNVGNMVINPYSFTIVLSYGIGKASVFPVNVLKKAFKDLKSKWGIAASVFLYHIGYYMGNVLGTMFKNEKFEPENVLKAFLEYLKSLGFFGSYNIKIFSPINRIATVKIYDSIECTNLVSSKPASHFLRGVFGGIFSTIFKKEVTVYETKCVAKGDRYCEFENR